MSEHARACDQDQPNMRQIGAVEVCVFERAAALERILAIVRSGSPQLVSFCNAHTVNLAARDNQFASALTSFLMLNDGVGIDLASRLLYGQAFPYNLVGTDFVPALLDAAPFGLRIYLLGSSADVVATAGSTFAKLYPRHTIVGTHSGFFSAAKGGNIAAEIKAAAPNLVLVGMGQPKQELWCLQNLANAPAVTMCVGALFEFTAGTFTRAPAWIRAARFEWLYRLALEPRRLGRRYLIGNLEFMARVFRDYSRQKRSSRHTRQKY